MNDKVADLYRRLADTAIELKKDRERMLQEVNRRIEFWRTNKDDSHGINTAMYIAMLDLKEVLFGIEEPPKEPE